MYLSMTFYTLINKKAKFFKKTKIYGFKILLSYDIDKNKRYCINFYRKLVRILNRVVLIKLPKSAQEACS